jgi:hypothetical protein
MTVYLVILIILSFLTFLEINQPKIVKGKILMIVIYSLLTIVAGLRYRLGPDTISYMLLFENKAIELSNLTYTDIFAGRYQPGWVLLESFFKEFDNWYFFQFTISMLFHVLLFRFIWSITTNRYTYLLVYFLICYLYLATDVLRESIAIGFISNSILEWTRGRSFRSFLFFLLAFMFHFYALIWILFVPILYSSRIKLVYGLFFILSLLGFYLSPNATMLINQTFLLLGFVLDLGYALVAEQEMNLSGIAYYLVKLGLLVSLYALSKKLKNVDKKRIYIYSSVLEIYIALLLIRMFFVPFAERFFNYLNIMTIAILVDWMKVYFNRFRISLKLISVFTTILFVFVYYIMPFVKVSETYGVRYYKIYAPYSSIFTKQKDTDREKIVKKVGKL